MSGSNNELSGVLPVVSLHKGVPVVTSMQVAEHFEKLHKNVLRDIRRIEGETPDREWVGLNFEPTFRIVAGPNNSQREETYYLITREGFMILGMGFTGPTAMGMKIAFIKAFAAMEQEITALRREPTAPACLGLSPAAMRLPVRQKVQLMNNATQIAKGEDRMAEVKSIYADLCNTVAEGSLPWAELAAVQGEASVRGFVEQCCEPSDKPQRRVLVSVFYGAYSTWCGVAAEEYQPVAQGRFLELLRRFAPEARISRPRMGAAKNRPLVVAGLALNRRLGLF